MTAWERAMGLIAELTSLDTGYDCCLTGESAINVIRTALADAERGAYENAAKVCEVEALIDDERGYYGKEMAKAIRAKATE